jgi:3'-phosphoadenosine 5'-phosphosulfate sulfotransferase (PAPS reductase)/FAD synthetase
MKAKVRLERYDWIVVNTSAGKDSQAMMDVVCKRAAALGLLDRVVAVHCELPEEWEGTKELAQEHAAHYGVRFEVVRREQGGLLASVEQRHANLVARGKTETPPWPSSTCRWCTSNLKRGPVSKLLTHLANETRERRGTKDRVRILNCLGLRAGESCTRAKLKPFRLDKNATNGRRIVHTWLPIHAWSADLVWSRIRVAGTRTHPAYQLGMPRLSCCFCVLAPRNALLLAGRHNPALLDRYVAVEDRVGFSFQAKLSLRSVRDAIERGEEPGPINTWEA